MGEAKKRIVTTEEAEKRMARIDEVEKRILERRG